MSDNRQNPPPQGVAGAGASVGKKTLAGLIGMVAAAGLAISIPQDESGGQQHLRAYRDIVGIWTVCDGDTHNVRPGMVETREGCQRRLEAQLLAHAEPVMACTPRLAEDGRDYQRWAAISLAYNIGTSAYCRSSVDRDFDAGQWRAGCDAILAWDRAGGRVIHGLQQRRQRERAICLRGLPS